MLSLFYLIAIFIASCGGVPSQITRPCKINDYTCIRNTMAANSKCNPKVYGMPSQYTIPSFMFETPYFNSTYFDYNLKIANHNKCTVSEFFYNSATDTAVISIDCPSLIFEANRLLVQHSTYKEDTYYRYDFKGLYPLIRLTMNIRNARAMNICDTFTYADVTALPILQISPNNKQTANFLSKDLSFLYIFEREHIGGRANFLMRYFINRALCDFGCNS